MEGQLVTLFLTDAFGPADAGISYQTDQPIAERGSHCLLSVVGWSMHSTCFREKREDKWLTPLLSLKAALGMSSQSPGRISCLNLALKPSWPIQMKRHHRQSNGQVEGKDHTNYSQNKLDVTTKKGQG